MKNFDALGQIVKDVAEVLEIMDLRDFDKAVSTIPKSRDLGSETTGSEDFRRIRPSSMLGSPGRKPTGPRRTRRQVRPSVFSPSSTLMLASRVMS